MKQKKEAFNFKLFVSEFIQLINWIELQTELTFSEFYQPICQVFYQIFLSVLCTIKLIMIVNNMIIQHHLIYKIYQMKIVQSLFRFNFSTITHIRGNPENKADNDVRLRGIHIQSTMKDSPNLIFIPEVFDQAESWLQFFSNPLNKIINHRNVYIVYPRNFGNSDRNSDMGWESHANDIVRFMYEHQISMATLGGHGLGGKIALAAGCYHHEKVTGICTFDTTPTNQYYFQPFHELRSYLNELKELNLLRPYGNIAHDLKRIIRCPKWRSLFSNNLVKSSSGYEWRFEPNAVFHNLTAFKSPSSLVNWTTQIGLYPGRSCFAFPEYSRYVYLNSNTLPMMKVCPRLAGYGQDIFGIQGDENPLNHWVYELEDQVNPYAAKLAQFVKHYDGVNVLLKNREQIGQFYVPDINYARVPADDFPTDRKPAHYYHNWRFNNVYAKQ